MAVEHRHSVLSRLVEEGDVWRQRLCGVGEELWMRNMKDHRLSHSWTTSGSPVFSLGFSFPDLILAKQRSVEHVDQELRCLGSNPGRTTAGRPTVVCDFPAPYNRVIMRINVWQSCGSASRAASATGDSALPLLLHWWVLRSLLALSIFDFCFLCPRSFREGWFF